MAEVMKTMDAVEILRAADSEQEISACVSRFAAQVGYEFWHMTRFMPNEWSIKPKKMLAAWPHAWMDQYDQQSLGRDDAIVPAYRTNLRPFRWSEIKLGSDGAKRIMQIAETDYRMRDGYCIPYFSVDGLQGAISFSGKFVDHDRSREMALELVAIYAYNRFNEMRATAPHAPLLTPRQREVLQWIAAGKTAWDVAIILNISEQTVRTLAKNAMERLNVHSRAQAIAEALRLREISL